MLINNKYNFIFVHIQKTAGSSIRKSLMEKEGTTKIGNAHSFITHNNIDNLENYFKFCFVRNPWDRLVSWYNMIIQKGFHNDWSKYLLENSSNFSEFLNLTEIIFEENPIEKISKEDYPKSLSFNQLDYISDENGNILVDFIGRFENLNQDFTTVTDKLGIENIILSHTNKYEHNHYRSYYNDIDIEKVYNLYKRDIDYFGYQF